MAGWSWFALAAVLLGAEILFVDAQFYLVFFGVAAALVGALLTLMPMSDSVQWLLFALLAIVALLLFRKRLYEKLRKPQDTVPEALSVGDRLTLPAPLAPGATCRVEYRGTTWSARNVDSTALHGEVVITHVEGLTLLVRQSS
jgi:inner membrane protein